MYLSESLNPEKSSIYNNKRDQFKLPFNQCLKCQQRKVGLLGLKRTDPGHTPFKKKHFSLTFLLLNFGNFKAEIKSFN